MKDMKTIPFDYFRCTGKNGLQGCKEKEKCARYTSPWGDYQPFMDMPLSECDEFISNEEEDEE